MHHEDSLDRKQLMMMNLEQLVSQENVARVIDAFVESLDLKKQGFEKVETKGTGRRPYHPGDLLKLYLYGYQNSIRSSRKLEVECERNLEMMWLLKGVRPKYHTIADFRKVHSKPFKEVFREFVQLLKGWDLIEGETIALDSFKIRAQNSKDNNYNDKKIKRQLKNIDVKIQEYLDELDRLDKQEDGVSEYQKTQRTQEILEKIKDRTNKRQEYEQLQEQLSLSGQSQISTTDPDARAVRVGRGGIQVGYNIQATADAKNRLLICGDIIEVNDTQALESMAKQSKSIMERDTMDLLADTGYQNGAQMRACEQDGIITYINPKKSGGSKVDPKYRKEAFNYDEENDCYICPQGHPLHTNGNWYQKGAKENGYTFRYKQYKTKACMSCPVRVQCTKGSRGRVIDRMEHQDVIDRNNARVTENEEYYRSRKQIIEHIIGTIKRARGFEYTLLRTKPKVLGEVHLEFICYNLRRSMSILGVKELIKRLKKAFSLIFSPWRWVNAHTERLQILVSTQPMVIQSTLPFYARV
jgi:transposase